MDLELCIRGGWLLTDLHWSQSASPIKSLSQSWSGMLSDLVHRKSQRRVWKQFGKLDCLAVLIRSWTVYKRWVTNGWPAMDSASPIKSLPQSWSGMLSDLVHRKTQRRVWKLFRKLDCLAVLIGSWTVYKRWVTNGWPAMDSASPLKSLPQSWSGMLRPGPPKNKEKSVKNFSETGLSCCADRILNCIQEMGN